MLKTIYSYNVHTIRGKGFTIYKRIYFADKVNRFVGKVSEDKIKYALARDLNNQELKKYLPIINFIA